MKIEQNKKINEAINLVTEVCADLKIALSQNGLIKQLTKNLLEMALPS